MARPVPDTDHTFDAWQEKKEYTREEKLRNWWLYHKGWIVFGVIFLLGAGYLIHDVFFRPKPDYQVALVSKGDVPAAVRANLQTRLEELGEDVNGDGQVLVEVLFYPIGFDEWSQMDVEATSSAVTRLTVDLTTGRVYLVLLDDPAGFQARIGALGYLDGGIPDADDETHGAADWEQMVFAWEDCPVLRGLDLGTYLPLMAPTSDDTVDGQKAMEGLYIGKRAMRSEAQKEAFAADERLWHKLTDGAGT